MSAETATISTEGVAAAVAGVRAVQGRAGTALMQVPLDPDDAFGVGEVDVKYLVTCIVRDYLAATENGRSEA